MSRRSGQNGCVLQRGSKFYGRYWVDEPDGRRQKTIPLGECRTKTIAKQKLRTFIEESGVNSVETFRENTTPGTTFRQQSVKWMDHLKTRTRRPVKLATLTNYQQILDKWLLPNLGDTPLSEVNNSAVRELVTKMVKAGLAPRSISDYILPIRLCVSSAVDQNGNEIFPRKWNADFIGLPVVDKTKQHRPTVSRIEAEAILSKLDDERYRVLVGLLLASGLRISEALGLHVEDLGTDALTVHVQRSVWRHGEEQAPKTPSAVRVVDLPKEFAKVLSAYANGKSGYLFSTSTKRPLAHRNVLRALHVAGAQAGFHGFRRFRTEVLRRAGVPETLVQSWLGHAKKTVTDYYASGLQQDEAWRRDWCERAGLSFTMPLVVSHVSQNVVSLEVENAA
jgi:integrase